MIVIKNALIYSPEKLGQKNLLITGGVIYKIAEDIDSGALRELGAEVIEAEGKIMVPGLID